MVTTQKIGLLIQSPIICVLLLSVFKPASNTYPKSSGIGCKFVILQRMFFIFKLTSFFKIGISNTRTRFSFANHFCIIGNLRIRRRFFGIQYFANCTSRNAQAFFKTTNILRIRKHNFGIGYFPNCTSRNAQGIFKITVFLMY